jgi:hypothetical protein
VKPHALYVGPLKELCPLVRCACGELISDGYDWCSEECAEAHHNGELPPKEPCTCTVAVHTLRMGHMFDCPRYQPHPEHFTHPLENA